MKKKQQPSTLPKKWAETRFVDPKSFAFFRIQLDGMCGDIYARFKAENQARNVKVEITITEDAK